MVPADREIIALIAYAQPVGLEVLRTVVPYDTLEAMEANGLIINVVSGWRHSIQLASAADSAPPGRLSLCQLRLRRALARSLRDTGLRRVGDGLALGRFQLDGMVTPEVETLYRAGRHALDTGDAATALRMADAVIRTGGGFAAALLRAQALAGVGDAAQAEHTFAALAPSTSDESAQLAAARARNLFHGLGRTVAARTLLTEARQVVGPAHDDLLAGVGMEIDRRCRSMPMLMAAGDNPVERATVALLQGRVRTAERHFRDAWRDGGSRATALQCLGGLVEIAALTDRCDDIGSLLELIAARSVEDCSIPSAELAPVWLLAACRDLATARRTALDTARRSADTAVVAQAFHLACRLGAAAPAADGLARLAGSHPLFDAYAVHAAALAGRDLNGLVGAAQVFAGLGAMLLAAEAVAWAGAEHHRCGRLGTAAGLAHRADGYLAQCEGARSPSLRLAELNGIPRLTTREREVSWHAARGMSNADISATLAISVRTVETHLSRAYHKLAVSGRAELPSALVNG